MKKALSVILAMLMLLSVAPMAFAEVIATADAPIAIAADAETTIELEQYNTGELTDADGATASFTIDVYEGEGKSYLYDGWIVGKKLVQTLQVSVEKAGTYDIELVVSTGSYSSTIAAILDGNTVPANYSYTTESLGKAPDYFHADFEASKKVFRADLTEGSHKLAISYPERGTSVGGGIAFAADYVKFIPVENTVFEIGENGATIEVEDVGFNAKREDNSIYLAPKLTDGSTTRKSGALTQTIDGTDTTVGHAFSIREQSYASKPLILTIPINVEKAGWYDVNAYLSQNSGLSQVHLYGRGEIINNATTLYRIEKLPYTYRDQVSYRYANRSYFAAGAQELTFRILTRTAPEANVGQIWFYADKITLTPVEIAEEDYAVISENGGTIEYEDYKEFASNEANVNVYDAKTAANNRASGSSFVLFDTSTKRLRDLYIDIPLTVEKSGLYDVELIASNLGTRFYVDEVAISLTRGSRLDGTWASQKGDYYCIQYFPAHPYTGKVYLTAGDHVFTTVSERRAGADYNDDIANALDCIKFTAVENTASYFEEDNSVYVEANTETVSGTAIIALYNGKELVGTLSYDVTDEELISGTVDCTKKPDTAKVFVWDSMETISPAMAPVIITVE